MQRRASPDRGGDACGIVRASVASKTCVWSSGEVAAQPVGTVRDRGLLVFERPLGKDEYIAAQVQHVKRNVLLELLLPGIHAREMSWLLLLYRASPCVQFCLRCAHDRDILRCLTQPVQLL